MVFPSSTVEVQSDVSSEANKVESPRSPPPPKPLVPTETSSQNEPPPIPVLSSTPGTSTSKDVRRDAGNDVIPSKQDGGVKADGNVPRESPLQAMLEQADITNTYEDELEDLLADKETDVHPNPSLTNLELTHQPMLTRSRAKQLGLDPSVSLISWNETGTQPSKKAALNGNAQDFSRSCTFRGCSPLETSDASRARLANES